MSNTAPFVVPKDVLEGSSQPFPVGKYISQETEVKEQWSEDKKHFELRLTHRNVSPVDGQDVGKRPMIQRIPVIFNEQSVVDVKEFTSETPYPLQISARLLASLALAVGAAQILENGSAAVENLSDFIDSLKAGLYAKQPVGFEVKHRGWKSKKDPSKSGTSAEISSYFGVA